MKTSQYLKPEYLKAAYVKARYATGNYKFKNQSAGGILKTAVLQMHTGRFEIVVKTKDGKDYFAEICKGSYGLEELILSRNKIFIAQLQISLLALYKLRKLINDRHNANLTVTEPAPIEKTHYPDEAQPELKAQPALALNAEAAPEHEVDPGYFGNDFSLTDETASKETNEFDDVDNSPIMSSALMAGIQSIAPQAAPRTVGDLTARLQLAAARQATNDLDIYENYFALDTAGITEDDLNDFFDVDNSPIMASALMAEVQSIAPLAAGLAQTMDKQRYREITRATQAAPRTVGDLAARLQAAAARQATEMEEMKRIALTQHQQSVRALSAIALDTTESVISEHVSIVKRLIGFGCGRCSDSVSEIVASMQQNQLMQAEQQTTHQLQLETQHRMHTQATQIQAQAMQMQRLIKVLLVAMLAVAFLIVGYGI